ncbi:helix-turn-helix transcriptional regulator [Listeria monocytogenes]|nr:helix-turn-helix transcriptional regulator [Listeria monocytogenes]EHM3395700.1 helix-turn-helix transcriptional regulator [Listeria monocytogenes]EKJ1381260.1 helix-turn-helix transcriptional regulator [Listeria monocytogenes]
MFHKKGFFATFWKTKKIVTTSQEERKKKLISANSIGTAFKKIRQYRQISQQELATSMHCSKTKIVRMENNQVEIAQETFQQLCFALHVTTLEVYKECFPKTNLREKIVEGAKYAFDFPIDSSLIQNRLNQCQLYLRKHPEAEIIRWLYQIQQAELCILLHTPIKKNLLDMIQYISTYYVSRKKWLPIDTILIRTLIRVPGFYRHMPKLEETILAYAESEALGYYELAPIYFYIAKQLIQQRKQLNAQFTMEKAWNAAKKAVRMDIYMQASHVLTKQFLLEEFNLDIFA